jgi:BirA family biotin operon repressor/biotin-[acetyl-CoA-carboxylase] ligase
MAAVAVTDAIAACSATAPVIKWPNDILIEGKKIAGVLTESACTADALDFVVLGAGVNVNCPRDLLPEAIRDRATSLLIVNDFPVRREDLFRGLIHGLDRCYGILEERGFEAIASEWKARFGLTNRPVRIEMSDGNLKGRALGIDRDGALLVQTAAGAIERVIAGDVIPLQD